MPEAVPADDRAAIPDWPALMTPRLAAKYVGFSVRWLQIRSATGEVPAVRVGDSPRYRRADLDRWIEGLN